MHSNKPSIDAIQPQRSQTLRSIMNLLLVLALSNPALAGKSCERTTPSTMAQQSAASAAQMLKAALDQKDKNLAIIARIGQDLSKQGLLYSHAAFAQRKNGQWQVIHLLNDCGTDKGALYAEGLLEFFSDSPVSYQSKIVWPTADLAFKIEAALDSHQGKAVFESRYSVIARHGSNDRQNSTAWLLEVVAAANNPLADSRQEAQLVLQSSGYQPDEIRIGYGKRIAGGLFKANAVFTDHPLDARLSGRYAVTTVRSIFRYMQMQNWIADSSVIAPKQVVENKSGD
jgi:hypothetical protein